ncbi:unnamed protein product [Caenorhabditis auriculariae]|uniref:Uncharacterized protein n=1 Tax=Caenorhabditis auriculariae TaxID=2777116 RepID=A0A8S1H3J8_9PELO|nr:unnamed protein product [Caenorhabditis auriculariae]
MRCRAKRRRSAGGATEIHSRGYDMRYVSDEKMHAIMTAVNLAPIESHLCPEFINTLKAYILQIRERYVVEKLADRGKFMLRRDGSRWDAEIADAIYGHRCRLLTLVDRLSGGIYVAYFLRSKGRLVARNSVIVNLPPGDSRPISLFGETHMPVPLNYCTVVISIIAFLLIVLAISTPAWQVVYARELRQWIQSGLWLACQTRPNGMYTCTYTFSQDDYNFYTSAEVANFRTPAFYPWQRVLLHVLIASQLFGLLSMVVFCVSTAYHGNRKFINGLQLCFLVICTILCVGSMVAFAVLSYMVEYRFYHVSVSGIYEKHRGYSYYIALVGTFFYVAATVVGVVHLARTLTQDRWVGGSSEPINAYRAPSSHLSSWPQSTNGSVDFESEHRFAMRSLPAAPQKQRVTMIR